ncbi:MAG TPA: chemotaxis protein CheB [Verrucomicrobiae bacterium]|nr:chemotaxis protein CheB [Verrucomicrobiae bacterium]
MGIGASAGGLEAATQLLRHLPARTGMAYVLVQHLDPTHDSQLTELLSRVTALPVLEVRNRMTVRPNHVYVIPPNKGMVIVGRALKLTPRIQRQDHNLPVDTFLKSLARDCGRKAAGVILSGTATDGAEGIRAIHAEGGITFAQDEKSAKYDGMPRAAVATGCVDVVASPPAIAKELARISRHPYINHLPPEKAAKADRADDDHLNRIFRLLKTATGVDFTYYKPNTIQRRIQRRMAVHRLQQLGQYIQYLKDHPDEAETLCEDLLISVTGFFRDAGAFAALKRKLFPKLGSRTGNSDPVRIWVPGCSTGEEAYSLAMLLLEYLGDQAASIPIQVFATDISERALAKARVGIYSESSVADVSPPRLRRFFVKILGGYQISKPVRELCIFAKQNITKDPPFSNLDLISCRNVLIYLGPQLQKRVMPIFHYALKPNRFLLLGSSEATSGFEQLFGPVDRKHRIYVRRATATRPTVDFSLSEYPVNETAEPLKAAVTGTSTVDIQREADRVLLGRFAPASVLVNDRMEILQFRGHTGSYLEPAQGSPSLNLLKMAREGLFMELRGAIHRARRQGVTIRREGLRVRSNGGIVSINLEVVPIKSMGVRERHFLVLFEESDHRPLAAPVVRPAPPQKAERLEKTAVRLEQELTATKEYMQSVVEELENANEELKAANEEIQSSNEELQSTNEELETAKEELQSTNEELTTLNEELQNRNMELGQLNNDLTNVLTSVSLPILLLGADYRVRRFTPAAEKVLHLLPTDVGRLITDLRLPLDAPDLERLITESIDSLSVKSREVQDRDGHWHALRIHPYRTAENKIDGAVIKLTDIDTIKRSLQEAEKARDFAQGIVETIHEPLLVLDGHLRVVLANRAFYQVFRVTRDETERKFIYDLGDKQWDIPALRALLEDILPRNSHLTGFEVDHVFPKIGRRFMLLNARRLRPEGDGARLILLAMEDATERRTLEKMVLDIGEAEQQRLGRDLHDGLGQHLTGVSFISETLQDRLASRKSPEAALAAKVTARIREAITQTRDLAKGLFPVELKTHGIVTALQKLALHTERLYDIGCRYKGETTLTIQEEVLSRQLYRIAQEAVFNAVKHSRGKHITISLSDKNGRITLTIKDDGIGIPSNKPRDTDMGLHIMKYRAGIIDARLDVRQQPRGGTVVTCIVENARREKGHDERQKATSQGPGKTKATGSHR